MPLKNLCFKEQELNSCCAGEDNKGRGRDLLASAVMSAEVGLSLAQPRQCRQDFGLCCPAWTSFFGMKSLRQSS